MASDRVLLFCRFLIVLVGLTMGILASGILLWWLPQPTSVTAYLQVNNIPSELKFLSPVQSLTLEEYKRFKQSQLVLLKSEFVLTAALSRRDISELNAVVSRRPDEQQWLSDELQVSFPDESEILMVNYEGDEDPEEMKKIIDAVVDAYQREVVYAEKARVTESNSSLEASTKKMVVELQTKREKYFMLMRELGSPPTKTEIQEEGSTKEITPPSKPTIVPNGELLMLQEEIEELKELRHDLTMYLRKMRIADEISGERIRVIQPAFSTENINIDQRYSLVALGGVGAFVVTCALLALIGKCCSQRDVVG